MTKYVVSTGHSSSLITLHPGDTLSTYGTVTNTTVSGAGDYVFAGGTASFTTLLLGGNEYVSSGGTAISTTVSNGGTGDVYAGTVRPAAGDRDLRAGCRGSADVRFQHQR